MKNLLIIMTFMLCVVIQNSYSYESPQDSLKAKRWYIPDFIPLQFAGNIGFISTGIGYSSTKGNYQIALLYGYTPAVIAKRTIHTVSAKNYFQITRFYIGPNQSIIPYLGLGLTVEIGGISFLKLPSYYPNEYYAPKALHFIGYGGIKFPHEFEKTKTFINGFELFAEGVAIDQFIWYKSRSSHIKFRDIFSLALGVNFTLR